MNRSSPLMPKALRRLSGDTVFTVLLAAFVGLLVALSLSYAPDARRMPLVIGVPTFLVLVLVTGSQVFEGVTLPSVAPQLARSGEAFGGEDKARGTTVRPWRATAWVLSFLVALYLAGILVATFAVTFAFLWIEGDESWPRAGLIAMLGVVVVYLIFSTILDTALYPGVVVELLRPGS